MKTILITGGSRGIGLAIAEKYLNTQEYNVVVTGRKEQTLEELSKEVDNKNFHTIAAKADDEEAADKTCKDVNEKFGSLDILINNAGTNPADSTVDAAVARLSCRLSPSARVFLAKATASTTLDPLGGS